MELTIRHLRCFVTVAEDLNLTRAAHRLHLSTSTVSEQISLLERSIGRQLFVRTSRRVDPTDAATELLPLAREAIAAMERVAAWAEGPNASSIIAIGVMSSSDQFRDLIGAVRAAQPNVDLRIRQLGFQSPATALTRHDLDAAVLAELGPLPHDADVVAYDLWSERLVLAVPDGDPLIQRRRVGPHDLVGQTLICGPSGPANPQWFATILSWLPSSPRILPTATNFEELIEMVAAGFGAAVVSESAMQMFMRPGVAFVPLTDCPVATTRLYVRRRDPSSAITTLVDTARRAFSGT